MAEDDLIDLHFSLGLAILNAFDLHVPWSKLLASCGGVHPDDASDIIQFGYTLLGRLLCQFARYPTGSRTFSDMRWTGTFLTLVGVMDMAKPRKSLKKPRSIAFSRQAGRCYYCEQPMWSEEPRVFALSHKITIGQARRFQCTGEHLKAHKDGGTAAKNNIVAACLFCNKKRHQRKEPLTSDQYRKLVEQRMSQGLWHDARLN